MDDDVKKPDQPSKPEKSAEDLKRKAEELKKNEEKLDEELKKKKVEVKKGFKGFYASLKEFISELLNIRVSTDMEATADTIREGISMKGHAAWILIFSIIVASIGLNVSSTPVVIGAMLISPLMGPILGIGFSIGINDIDTLRLSMINFAVTVVLSILTSFLFFSIPIFQQDTPELLSRTKPDVRDVLIAISSGIALFVAISNRKPLYNVIAGVAIATALMPPLCTAGYGLAIWNLSYFGGALFLFTINSIFIALAAFAITKYLRFPMVRYINQIKRKRISQLAMVVATIVLLFSIHLFYNLFLENKFETQAQHFITDLKEKEHVNIIGESDETVNYKDKEIKLYIFGNEFGSSDIERWRKRMKDYGLEGVELTVLQSHDDSRVRNDIEEIRNMYINSHKLLTSREETIFEKDRRIHELESKLNELYKSDFFIDEITKEIKINYENLDKIAFSRKFLTDFNKIDTLYQVSVKWNDKLDKKQRAEQEKKLSEWLKTRFHFKDLKVQEMQ